MVDQTVRGLIVVFVVALIASESLFVTARYLPTKRQQDDRLDKLRELLKDLMDNDHTYERRPPTVAGYGLFGEDSPQMQQRLFKRNIGRNAEEDMGNFLTSHSNVVKAPQKVSVGN